MKHVKETALTLIEKILDTMKSCQEISQKDKARLAGKGMTLAQITELSHEIGVTIPKDYQLVLSKWDGLNIGTGGIMGSRSIRNMLNDYPEFRDYGWLPIASDGCGNFYIISTKEHLSTQDSPVFFVETVVDPDQLAYVVASNIWHFFIFSLQESKNIDDSFRETGSIGSQKWPFDKKYMLSHDPDIALFHPLPWEV